MHNIKCPQWRELVANETGLEYFKNITSELEDISNSGVAVYPNPEQRFKALELTTFADTKVVILGQDPYHGPGQAHGLAFSVPNGLTKPPSLRNIHKELCSDLGINPPKHGDLSSWAKQGVLLLNSSLSVISGQAGSHSKLGWHTFTDQIIRHLNNRRQAIVFMLWGKHAMGKSDLITAKQHLVLTAAHPSPLSAYRGFFGCKHFSKANAYLKQNAHQAINWG